MTEIKNLYKENNNYYIFIIGKVLSSSQMQEIEDFIKSKINIEIKFDYPKVLGLHGIKHSFNKEIAVSKTKFHRGSLRSGQRLEFEGSLVILGDVNGGAEVIAEDNIIVLGILRGLAHAGAKGNKEAIIAATSIESPQIRISNIIKECSKDKTNDSKLKTSAYVDEEDKIMFM